MRVILPLFLIFNCINLYSCNKDIQYHSVSTTPPAFLNKIWYLDYEIDSTNSNTNRISIDTSIFNHGLESLLFNSDSSVYYVNPVFIDTLIGKWNYFPSDSILKTSLQWLSFDGKYYYFPYQKMIYLDSNTMVFKYDEQVWNSQERIGDTVVSSIIHSNRKQVFKLNVSK